VSCIGSPCYVLSGSLHKIYPLAGKSESFVKNSDHFIQLLKCVNLQSLDTLVSFAISPFTIVPGNEARQVMSNKLHHDDTLAERSALQAEAIMELLGSCLRSTYFQALHDMAVFYH
jgi:hypothetical protein